MNRPEPDLNAPAHERALPPQNSWVTKQTRDWSISRGCNPDDFVPAPPQDFAEEIKALNIW